MRAVLPLLCLLGLIASGRADEQQFVAECQMVVLPQKAALPLLGDLLDEAKIEAAYARIQEMIAKGTAQLAGNPIVRMAKDERGESETIEEVRYATQFDPPNLPQNVPENVKVLQEWPIVGITPTAFEVRKVGVMLEIGITPERNGQAFRANVVCQHVRFLRWAKADAGKVASGERLSVDLPVFHTAKTTCSVLMRSGQRVLLSVHKTPDSADSLELFLLRITAARTDTP